MCRICRRYFSQDAYTYFMKHEQDKEYESIKNVDKFIETVLDNIYVYLKDQILRLKDCINLNGLESKSTIISLYFLQEVKEMYREKVSNLEEIKCLESEHKNPYIYCSVILCMIQFLNRIEKLHPDKRKHTYNVTVDPWYFRLLKEELQDILVEEKDNVSLDRKSLCSTETESSSKED